MKPNLRLLPPPKPPTPQERDAFARWLARWLADVAENERQGKRAA